MFLCLQFLVMGRKYSKLCVLRLFSYNSLFKFIEWLSGGGSAPKWASIADGRQANNCILYGNAMETKGGSIKRLFVIADGIQWSNWISKMVFPSRDWRKKNPSGLSIRQTFLHSYVFSHWVESISVGIFTTFCIWLWPSFKESSLDSCRVVWS